jgi:hypothetical protein
MPADVSFTRADLDGGVAIPRLGEALGAFCSIDDSRGDPRSAGLFETGCRRNIFVAVAAGNDERPNAHWNIFSGAHWLKRKQASDAQSLRHSAYSVRQTRDSRRPADATVVAPIGSRRLGKGVRECVNESY